MTALLRTFRVGLWVSITFASVPLSLAATVDGVNPVSGMPGDTVVISGTFDPIQATVKVGEEEVGLASASANQLTFVIPGGLVSGVIEVEDGGDVVSFPLPLLVRREISGTFIPPAGIAPIGFTVVAGSQESLVANNGTFTTQVTTGKPTTVWLFKPGQPSTFLATVTDSDVSVIVSAESTAVAMVVNNPLAGRPDSAEADALIAQLETQNELSTLRDVISMAAQENRDYLDDARFDPPFITLLESTIPPPPAGLQSRAIFKPLEFEDAKLTEINLTGVSPVFESKLTLDAKRPEDYFLLENARTSSRNSLDWGMELFRVSPQSFPNGLDSISGLDGLSAVVPANTVPLQTGFARAELLSAKLDLLAVLADEVFNVANGLLKDATDLDLAPPKTAEFRIDRRIPEIYLLQAYSGNVALGLGLQEDLLDQVDPNSQWAFSLAGNVLIAALDAVGAFADVGEVLGIDGAFIYNLNISLAKTLAVYRGREGLDTGTFLDIAKSAAVTTIKTFYANAIGGATAEELSKRAAKTIAKTFDVLGKVSSGLQAAERSAGLLRDRTLAIERSVLVVGNPFKPFISEVSPNEVRAGQLVTVTGGNFGTDAGELVVSLCQFSDTSGNVATELVVAPTSVTPTQIRFEIPAATTFRSSFPNGEAFVCIVKSGEDDPDGGNLAKSSGLGEEGKVIMPLPPVITAIQPSTSEGGGTPDVIVGNNRSITLSVANGSEKMQARVDGSKIVEVLQSQPGQVVALLPFLNAGPHTIQILSEDELGPVFSFNVVIPTDETRSYPGGSTITITLMDMSNEADGEISLKEAFLIANGGLGRPIEVHTNDEPGGTPREVDHVSTLNGGAGNRDTIKVSTPLKNGVYTIGEALPELSEGDRFEMGGITLNGTGAPAGADGLVLDNSSDVEVRDLILIGFKGEGIRVTNGTKGADILNVTIDGAGSHGIFIDTDCSFNSFDNVEILQVGGRGLSLSGNCDHNSFDGFQIDGTGDTGVWVAFGSDENVFDGFAIVNVTGTGILLEENVTRNRFKAQCDVSVCTVNGIHLKGSGTLYNEFYNDASSAFADAGMVSVSPAVRDCNGYGLLIEGGASSNHVIPKFISNNALGGVRITGAGTFDNTVGHPYRIPPVTNFFPVQKLFFSIITDNAGPGIVVESGTSQTLLTGLSVHGNSGDGIRLESSSFNSILSVRSGIQDFIDGQDAVADPNTGASIRMTGNSTNNEVGTILEVTKFNFGRSATEDFTNILANDTGGGIILDGECDNNLIYGTFVGGTTTEQSRVGGNGLALLNGASSNRIGSLRFHDEFIVLACEDTAILIDGADSTDNLVKGVAIGSAGTTPETQVRNGIHLRNGTNSNFIGGAGPMIGGGSQFTGSINATVRISGISETGIWLEACGGTVGTDLVASRQNRIHNCSVRNGETGMLISDNAKVNEIGGFLGGGPKGGGFFQIDEFYSVDNNSISGCRTAGLRFSRMTLTSPLERNPIRNLYIGNFASAPTQPLDAEVPEGVGILIDPDASHIIIGEDPSTPVSVGGCSVGVYIDQSGNNRIRALNVASDFTSGNAAGIVINAASENVIGGAGLLGNNIEYLNNSAGPAHGIALFGSDENTIEGNKIQFCGGAGIYIENSALNLIGGQAGVNGNQLLGNGTHGIHFTGAATLSNRVHSNFIGIDRGGKRSDPFDSFAHTEHGILLEGGASGNRIGGEFVKGAAGVTLAGAGNPVPFPAGNTIIGNTGRGVIVSGGSTRANPILDNSISENLEDGIVLAAGNDSVPTPTGTFSPGVATGTVPDLNAVPPGSTVQIFSDSGQQGEVLLGTTTVKAGGTWLATSLTGAVYPNVTATFTHPTSNSTSQFGLLTGAASSFTVERTGGGAPNSQTVPFIEEAVVQRITLTAEGSDVRVGSLTFKGEGTLDDLSAIAEGKLYRDNNGDGVRDSSDPELAGEAVFDEDDGLLKIENIGEIIEAGSPQDWLVVYLPNSGIAQEGETFELKINDATGVEAETFFPAGIPVTATNPFPVRSDLFTIGSQPTGLTFATFISTAFPGIVDTDVVGPLADPDKDLIVNIFEFLFGTDPDDSSDAGRAYTVTESGRIGIEFKRAKNLEGITVSYEESINLDDWDPSTDGILTEILETPRDTVRYTILRSGDKRFLRIKIVLD
ncbi:MAG: right-handed parallel beta-helix repeat-containing protein [Luteolibacter sp.]